RRSPGIRGNLQLTSPTRAQSRTYRFALGRGLVRLLRHRRKRGAFRDQGIRAILRSNRIRHDEIIHAAWRFIKEDTLAWDAPVHLEAARRSVFDVPRRL